MDIAVVFVIQSYILVTTIYLQSPSCPQTRPSKSRQIGKASLGTILAHAEEDRILSKRREKTSSYHAAAPTTQ